MTKNLKLRSGSSWMNLTPIYGNGFPNGVVSASVGSTYIDTAATNGAIEWKKATGAGNTGWVVSVGDTGWRNIDAWFVADNISSTPGYTSLLRWRRVGNSVNVRGTIRASAPVATTSRMTMRPFFTFPNDNSISPSGWDVQRIAYIANSIGRIAPQGTPREYGAQTLVTAGNWADGDNISFNEFFPIENVGLWPVTLPGSSV